MLNHRSLVFKVNRNCSLSFLVFILNFVLMIIVISLIGFLMKDVAKWEELQAFIIIYFSFFLYLLFSICALFTILTFIFFNFMFFLYTLTFLNHLIPLNYSISLDLLIFQSFLIFFSFSIIINYLISHYCLIFSYCFYFLFLVFRLLTDKLIFLTNKQFYHLLQKFISLILVNEFDDDLTIKLIVSR